MLIQTSRAHCYAQQPLFCSNTSGSDQITSTSVTIQCSKLGVALLGSHDVNIPCPTTILASVAGVALAVDH